MSKMKGSDDEISYPDPASSTQEDVFKRATTYLSKIALVLRDAPNWMLTFAQLMERLIPLISEDRKCLENNIRVCLSSHNCFIKIPVNPNSLNSKKNYWKLDCSEITAKMVRRHFNGLLQFFPELASKLEMENLNRDRPSSEPASSSAVQAIFKVKFTSPFSIESLLKSDSPPDRPPIASPPSSVAQQPLLANANRCISCYPAELLILQTATGISPQQGPAHITHSLLTASTSAASTGAYTEPSSAPYFTSRQHSFII